MTPLEGFLLIILAGILLLLLYFYLQGDSMAISRARTAVVDTGEKIRYGMPKGKINEDINFEKEDHDEGKIGDTMSGINEKARSAFAGATDKINIDKSTMDGVTEKVSGFGNKVKGTVKGVPVKSDELSDKIDIFMEERKDQIINDWELATKTEFSDLEKRYLSISTDITKLSSSFNEFKATSNKKFKDIEDRLLKLEKP